MDNTKEANKTLKILKNDILGRYISAGKRIQAGEVIQYELPTLIVPFNDEKRCTNCFKLTESICGHCKALPLCTNCSSHNYFECDFLNKLNLFESNIFSTNVAVYGVIKLLLLNENPISRKLFEQIMLLESHQDERRGSSVWLDNTKCIVEPILSSPEITFCFKQIPDIDEELIQRICGIIDVNCFEIRAPGEGSMRAIYLQASLIAHSCIANTSIAIDDNNQMKVFASCDIDRGEMLTYCYTNPLLGTEERRCLLKIGKYFNCKCLRCEDPTELGSYMSSILCKRCKKGIVIRSRDVWTCETCNFAIENDDVVYILKKAKREFLSSKDDIRQHEMIIARYSKIFHKNHYFIIDVKQNIAAILRSYVMNPTIRPTKLVLERKMSLCKDILSLLQIVQPGLSRMKAIATYEVFTSFAELSRLKCHIKEITERHLLELLNEAKEMLRDAIKTLLYEPPNSPEGRLCKNMMKELKDLQNDIKLLSQ